MKMLGSHRFFISSRFTKTGICVVLFYFINVLRCWRLKQSFVKKDLSIRQVGVSRLHYTQRKGLQRKLQILSHLTRHKILFTDHILLPPQLHAEVQARLQPLHTEVQTEGDGVVLVIDSEHVRDLKT